MSANDRDEVIRVGDMVMVVRAARCGCSTLIGVTFKVTGFAQGDGYACKCGNMFYDRTPGVMGYKNNAPHPNRLKKLHPPAQDETINVTDEVTA